MSEENKCMLCDKECDQFIEHIIHDKEKVIRTIYCAQCNNVVKFAEHLNITQVSPKWGREIEMHAIKLLKCDPQAFIIKEVGDE